MNNFRFSPFQNRVAVSGVAGSGKTLIAVEAARRCASKDRRVLYLCFNAALSLELEEIERTRKNKSQSDPPFDIRSYGRLCRELVNDKIREQDPVRYIEKNIRKISRRYDDIFVDEAQDFKPSALPVLEHLIGSSSNLKRILLRLIGKWKENSKLWFFYDPDQMIYHDSSTGTDTPPLIASLNQKDFHFPTRLQKNFRNGKNIAIKSYQYVSQESSRQDLELPDSAPEGLVIDSGICSNPLDVAMYIAEQINVWIKGGINPGRIAVLNPDHLAFSGVREFLREELCTGRFHLLQDAHRIATRNTPFSPSTSRLKPIYISSTGFKGLEADAVLLLQPMDSEFFDKTKLYIGASRARDYLSVVSVPVDYSYIANLIWNKFDDHFDDWTSNQYNPLWREKSIGQGLFVSLGLGFDCVRMFIRGGLYETNETETTQRLEKYKKNIEETIGIEMGENKPYFLKKQIYKLQIYKDRQDAIEWIKSVACNVGKIDLNASYIEGEYECKASFDKPEGCEELLPLVRHSTSQAIQRIIWYGNSEDVHIEIKQNILQKLKNNSFYKKEEKNIESYLENIVSCEVSEVFFEGGCERSLSEKESFENYKNEYVSLEHMKCIFDQEEKIKNVAEELLPMFSKELDQCAIKQEARRNGGQGVIIPQELDSQVMQHLKERLGVHDLPEDIRVSFRAFLWKEYWKSQNKQLPCEQWESIQKSSRIEGCVIQLLGRGIQNKAQGFHVDISKSDLVAFLEVNNSPPSSEVKQFRAVSIVPDEGEVIIEEFSENDKGEEAWTQLAHAYQERQGHRRHLRARQGRLHGQPVGRRRVPAGIPGRRPPVPRRHRADGQPAAVPDPQDGPPPRQHRGVAARGARGVARRTARRACSPASRKARCSRAW